VKIAGWGPVQEGDCRRKERQKAVWRECLGKNSTAMQQKDEHPSIATQCLSKVWTLMMFHWAVTWESRLSLDRRIQ